MNQEQYKRLLRDPAMPPKAKTLMQFYLSRPQQDEYQQCLDLMDLFDEDVMPESLATAVRQYLLQETRRRPEAWNDLGSYYYRGVDGTCQPLKAKECFEKGEQAGDIFSTQNLGYLYRYGQGIPQDLNAAWACFAKASLNGLMDATLNLAMMCENGLGQKKDVQFARRLYDRLYSSLDLDDEGTLYISACLGLGRTLLETQGIEQARPYLEEGLMAADQWDFSDDPLMEQQIEQARRLLKENYHE